ncbi:MAG: hypothetical protein QOF83_738 [Solirubrobacteraceae bacterium]|nr:hypothetical protein [Solirubrobacteraceae bacterium]
MFSLHRASRTADPAVAATMWIRNARRTRAWAAIAVLWAVIMAGLRFRSGGHPTDVTLVGNLILGALFFGMAILGLLVAGRVARAGLWVGRDGIVVRGPFRTAVVPIDEAGLFAPGLQGAGGNGTPCPMLSRRDGAGVGVWALGRRNVWFRYERLCQEIQPLCDELNGLVETLRSAPDGRG